MKLDDSFLAEVGLQEMPEEQKKHFLEYAQGELETRVGEKMSEGLSLEQMKEFERLMEGDQEEIRKMVAGLERDFREDTLYQRLLKKHKVSQGNWEILGEYLFMKWVQKNRPNYREIVTGELEGLKSEILANRERILAA